MSKSKKAAASAAAPAASGSGLPSHLEDIRTKVFVQRTHLDHCSAAEDPAAFRASAFDNAFTLADFKKQFSLRITEKSDEHLKFDLIGASAPIANALRRILISDVATMAIEKVILFQNTSLIQDEVLAHRIGLIPINADPHAFRYVHEDDGEPSDANTTVFTLDVACTRNQNASHSAPAEIAFNNAVVYSSALKWVPQGDQEERFASAPIAPVHDDIVLAKLRPGQVIQAELHVVKGVGRDHAKWSPAATAYYRQMPEISFASPVVGAEASVLKAACPMNVFDIEDVGGAPTLVTARPRDCTMCRECVRAPEHEAKVRLRRVRDHFEFVVESAGQLRPEVMVRDAIEEFKKKLGVIYTELVEQERGNSADAEAIAADE